MYHISGQQPGVEMGSEVLSAPIFYINGKRHALPEGRAEINLLQYLRGE